MNEYTKKAIGASGSLLLLASMGATAMAAAPQAASAEEGQALEWEADQGATKVQEKTVEGTFSFSQEAVTPTDVIRKGFAQIPQAPVRVRIPLRWKRPTWMRTTGR